MLQKVKVFGNSWTREDGDTTHAAIIADEFNELVDGVASLESRLEEVDSCNVELKNKIENTPPQATTPVWLEVILWIFAGFGIVGSLVFLFKFRGGVATFITTIAKAGFIAFGVILFVAVVVGVVMALRSESFKQTVRGRNKNKNENTNVTTS